MRGQHAPQAFLDMRSRASDLVNVRHTPAEQVLGIIYKVISEYEFA